MKNWARFLLFVSSTATAIAQTVPAPPVGGPIPTINLGAGSIEPGESVLVTGVAPAGFDEVRIAWLLDTTGDGVLDSMQSAALAATDGSGNYSATIESDASWDGGTTIQVCAAVSGAVDAEYACASLDVSTPPDGTIDGTIPLDAIVAGGTVTVKILDRVTGAEVATGTASATTGAFSIAVPPGTYSVVYGGDLSRTLQQDKEIEVASGLTATAATSYPECEELGLVDSLDHSFSWNDYITAVWADPGRVKLVLDYTAYETPDGVEMRNTTVTTADELGYYITTYGMAEALGGDPLDVELAAYTQVIDEEPYAVRFKIVDSTGAELWHADDKDGPDENGVYRTTVPSLDHLLPAGTYSLEAVPILDASGNGEEAIECFGHERDLIVVENLNDTALGGDVSISWDAASQKYQFAGYVPNFSGGLSYWFPTNDSSGTYNSCPWQDVPLLGDLCSGYQAGVYIEGSMDTSGEIAINSWKGELEAQILGRNLFPQQEYIFQGSSAYLMDYVGEVGELFDPFDLLIKSGDHRLFNVEKDWTVYKGVLATFWGVVSVNASVTLGLDAAVDLLMEQFLLRPETAATFTSTVEPSLKLSIWVDLLMIASAGADATVDASFTWPITMSLDKDEQVSFEPGDLCIGLEAMLDVWAKIAWSKFELGNYSLFCVEKGQTGCFCPASAARGTVAATTSNLPDVMAAPSVATDASGNRLVVWTEDTMDGGVDNMVIRASQWDSVLLDWKPADTISDSNYAGLDPSVDYYGTGGRAVVVYANNTVDEHVDPVPATTALTAQQLDISYALWDPALGGSWTAPAPLVSDDALNPKADGMPDVAGSSTGFTVAWTRDAGDGDITTRDDVVIAVRHFEAGTWSDITTLDASAAFSAAGVASAAPTNYAVDVARIGDSVALAWTADSDADALTNANRRIAVAMGTRAAGDPAFFTWSTEVLPSGTGFPDWTVAGAQQPAICFDPDDGSVYVFYTVRAQDEDGATDTGAGNNNELWWAHRSPLGVWTGGQVMDEGIPVYAEKPEVDYDSHGDLAVVMRRFGRLDEGTIGVNAGKNFAAGQLAVSYVDTTTDSVSAPAFFTFGENDGQQWQPHFAIDRAVQRLIVASVRRDAGADLSQTLVDRLPCLELQQLTSDTDPVEIRMLQFGSDLLVEQPAALSQEHAPVGTSVLVSATIRNVGIGDASAIQVDVFENETCTGTPAYQQTFPINLAFQGTYNFNYAVDREPGTQWICIRAYDPDQDATNECMGNSVVAIDLGAMSAPTTISAQASTKIVNAIDITVVESPTTGVSGYRFLRTTDPDAGPWDNIGESTETVFTDRDVPRGVALYYKAQAYDDVGTTSADSAVVSTSLQAVKQTHRTTPGGTFDDPTAWSEGEVPGSGDEFLIDAAGTYVVDALNDIVSGEMKLGDDLMSSIELNLAGATLELKRRSEILPGATLRMNGATVDLGETSLDVDGTIVAQGPGNSLLSVTRPHVDGLVSVLGDLSFAKGLSNHGMIELQSPALNEPAALDIETGTLINERNTLPDPPGTIELLAGPDMNYIRAAHIVNRGSILVDGATEITPLNAAAVGAYENFGTLTTMGGDLSIDAPVSGSRVNNWNQLIVAAGDTLSITGAAINNFGTLQVAAGAGVTHDATFDQRSIQSVLSMNAAVLTGPLWRFHGGALEGTGVIVGDVEFAIGEAAATFDLRPGFSAGQLTVDGNCSFGKYINMDGQIGGTTPGTEHDYLYVTGTASLDGTLLVSLINGYTPTDGESVTLIQADGGITGQFAQIDRSALPAGTSVDVLYTSNAVQIRFDLSGGQCNSDAECDDVNDCTTEYCDLNTQDCIYTFEAAGTACGSPLDDECTNPDTCDGAGACLANDAADGTTCQTTGTCLAGECDPTTYDVVMLPEGSYVGSDAEDAYADGSTVYLAGNVIDASLVDHAAVWESTDGGQSFTLVELPEAAGGPSQVHAIACDASGICSAVGLDGASKDPAYFRRDGTGTWTRETPPISTGAVGGIVMDGEYELTSGDFHAVGFLLEPTAADQKAAYWIRSEMTATWSLAMLPDLGGNSMATVVYTGSSGTDGIIIAGGVQQVGGSYVPALWVETAPGSGTFTLEQPSLPPGATGGMLNAFEYDALGRLYVGAGVVTLLDGTTRAARWQINSVNLYDERDLLLLPPLIGYTDSSANALHPSGLATIIYGASEVDVTVAATTTETRATRWRRRNGPPTREDASARTGGMPSGCYVEREKPARTPKRQRGGPPRGSAERMRCPPPAIAASGTAETHAGYAALAMPGLYKYWKDPVNGNWSDATKWVDALGDPVASAPGAGEEAFITVDGTYTVTLDVDATIHSLTVGGASGTQTLSVTTARTLTLTGDTTNSAVFDVLGSLTIANGGTVDLTQGTQNVSGTVTINGGTTRVGPSTTNSGDGEIRLGGTQTLEIDGSYTEQPSPAASLVLSGAVTVTAVGGSATFINNDFMQLNCNDVVDSSIAWTNNGTTEAERDVNAACAVAMNGPVTNPATGTLRVYYLDTGANPALTLALAQDLTNEGLIELRGTGQLVASTLRVGGGTGTLTNLGQIRAYLDSGTGNGGTIAAQVINQGTITVDSDAMTINNGGVVDLTQGTQEVPSAHTLTINGGTTRVGPSTNNTGDGEVRLGGTQTLKIDGSYTEQPSPAASLVLSGAVTVTAVGGSATFINNDFIQLNCNDVVDSSIAWTNNGTTEAERDSNAACTVAMNGPVTNPATGTLRVYYFDTGVNPALTLALAQDLTNEGLIELRGTGQLVGSTLRIGGGSGTLTNLGQIRAYLDSGTGNGGTIAAQVINQGTITADSDAMTINNGGVVDLTQGTQEVPSAHTLTINGGTTRVGPSTTNTGDGEVRLAGTQTLKIDGSYTEQPSPAASLVLSGAVTVTAVGSSATFINNDFIQLNCNDVVQSSIAWTNNGTTEAERGANATCTVTMNGPISNPATGTLRVYYLDTGARPKLTLSLAQDLTNEGLIELRGTAVTVGSTLIVGGGSGTLTNLGQIHAYIDTGTGGGGKVAAQVINQGIITVDSDSMTMDSSSGAHENSGTIDIPIDSKLTIPNGTLHLNGGSVVGEGSIVFNGSLLHGHGEIALPFSSSSTSVVAHDGPLAIGDATSTDGFSIGGSLDVGAEEVTLYDSDTPTISGPITIGGGTLVSASGIVLSNSLSGFGTVEADVQNGKTMTVGASPGILSITGNYTQTAAGILNMEIGGTALGTEFDHLIQMGPLTSATLGGTLNVTLINGYIPQSGTNYQIISSNAVVGTFASVNGLSNQPCDSSFTINYHPFDVTLTGGGGCDDGNACTDNICDVDTCVYPDNYVSGVECCNPFNGLIEAIDDGNICTTDSCNAATGEVTHEDATPSGFCCNPVTGQFLPLDDGLACTTDSCNPDGSVEHTSTCATSQVCLAETGECECTTADPAMPEAAPVRKSRYLSFVPGNAGVKTAIRVIPRVLTGYEYAEDVPVWVGAPANYPEEDSSQPGLTFVGARLSCEPHFHDWGTIDLLHVFGGEIHPKSSYDVQVICRGADSLSNEANYSAPLVVNTGVWADCAPPFAGDDPSVPQPDFTDIASVVEKFLDEPGAPIKAQAQLQPNTVIPSRPIDFRDISDSVAAFLGEPYPYFGPCTCPSAVPCDTVPCSADAACGNGYCLDGFCTDPCGRCSP